MSQCGAEIQVGPLLIDATCAASTREPLLEDLPRWVLRKPAMFGATSEYKPKDLGDFFGVAISRSVVTSAPNDYNDLR